MCIQSVNCGNLLIKQKCRLRIWYKGERYRGWWHFWAAGTFWNTRDKRIHVAFVSFRSTQISVLLFPIDIRFICTNELDVVSSTSGWKLQGQGKTLSERFLIGTGPNFWSYTFGPYSASCTRVFTVPVVSARRLQKSGLLRRLGMCRLSPCFLLSKCACVCKDAASAKRRTLKFAGFSVSAIDRGA